MRNSLILRTPARKSVSPHKILATHQLRVLPWWHIARLAFGATWLVDAFLQWRSASAVSLDQLIAAASQQQPSPLASLINVGRAVVQVNPGIANGILTGLEATIAIALLVNFQTRWALRASVALAAAIWVFGQGVGMVFMPGATDVQSGPLYAMVSLILLAAAREAAAVGAKRQPRPIR